MDRGGLLLLGFLVGLVLGLLIGVFGIPALVGYYSSSLAEPTESQGSTSTYAIEPSLDIREFIAAVKQGIAEAQSQYQTEGVGPPLLVKEFYLDVNLEVTGQIQGEAATAAGAASKPLDLKGELRVATARSTGKTHTVRLHFENAVFDLAKQLIEECVRLSSFVTDREGILQRELQLELQLEQLQQLQAAVFEKCVKRLPDQVKPVSTMLMKIFQSKPQSNED